jgi:hypothetical protein
MKIKRLGIYLIGLLTGTGIALGVASYAGNPVAIYSFKDGQVISADTMNDMFSQIQNVVVGFASESELLGDWNCTTYDASSNAATAISSAPSGAGAKNFAPDSATGLYVMNQVWSFTSNGTNLSTNNNTQFGGISNNGNITGACNSSGINYSAKIIQSTLLVSGKVGGCAAGNGFVLQLVKNSPYQFHTTNGSTFISCQAVNQPPGIPIGLSATVNSSGVALNWTDTSNGAATSFTILKKVNGNYSSIGNIGAGTTSFTDSAGAAGAMYRIQANNSANSLNSLPSAAAIAQ